MNRPARRRAYPRLLADVGGTHVRFALQDEPGGPPTGIAVLDSRDHPTLAAAAKAYLERTQAKPRTAAFAVASPVSGDRVDMTNSTWSFTIDALRRALGLETLRVINDFTAVALALPHLPEESVEAVGGGRAVPETPMAVIGPGTGLGVSGLIPGPGGWTPLASEGGHVTLAPVSELESRVLAVGRRRFGHVSAERLVSGPGLVNLCRILADIHPSLPLPVAPERLTPEDVTRHALARRSELCETAVELFCRFLGSTAGNLALTLGARGGVYIAGGIVPQLGAAFAASGFRRRFEAKGRFAPYLAAIPTRVVRHETPALLGLAALPPLATAAGS